MTPVNKIVSVKQVFKNNIDVNIDMKIIAIYSAKKIITKRTDLYSVLNPLTNSLSPSAKSKGDRLASAKTETENNKNIIANQTPTPIIFFWDTSYIKNIIDDSKIIDILTSYLIVWATARTAPKSEYFLLLLHPAPRVPYTPTLAAAIIIIKDNLW